jgi:hypothetical protein
MALNEAEEEHKMLKTKKKVNDKHGEEREEEATQR